MRYAILIGAMTAIIVVAILSQTIHVNASTVHRYRRPYAVLVGISPTKTLVFKCHNRNFKIPKTYLFGGCKEIHR